MPTKSVLLIGAGSQGRVTLDILLDQGREVEGFLDDNSSLQGTFINQYKVIGPVADITRYRSSHQFIVTIGNNVVRRKVITRLNLPDSSFCNAVHPSSVILPSSQIGHGNMIFAQTFVGSNAEVGHHVILNNGCVVEHDCIIGNFSALGPGCCMGGRVEIGEGAFISTGVTLAPRVKVGNRTVVGAGATVVHDLPDDVLAYGTPARVIRTIFENEMWERLL